MNYLKIEPIEFFLFIGVIFLLGALIGSSATFIALRKLKKSNQDGYVKEIEFLENEAVRLSTIPAPTFHIEKSNVLIKMHDEIMAVRDQEIYRRSLLPPAPKDASPVPYSERPTLPIITVRIPEVPNNELIVANVSPEDVNKALAFQQPPKFDNE